MLSKLVRDAVGDILDVIEELAPWRNQLVELYNAYKNPISFINKYMRDFPSSSRQWAGIIYRSVRYLSRQEEVLPLQGDNTPLDRRLAGQIPSPADNPGLDYAFRYNIQLTVSARDASQSHVFNFWFNSGGLLSEADVRQGVASSLITLVNRYKLTFNEGFPNTAVVTSSQIMEFVQYIPGLNRG